MVDSQLLDMVVRAYGFTDVELERYFEGYGSKYVALLQTNEGRFVLKGMYGVNEPFFSMYQYLKSQRYPHMFTIKQTLNERLFIEIDGTLCYLYEYINGQNMKSTNELFFEIAAALGMLHRIEVQPGLPIWDVHSLLNDIRNDRIPYVASRHQHLLEECADGCAKLLSLPKAIIHGDVAESNGIMNTADNRMVLIDWDGCGVAPRIIDVGYVVFGLLSNDLAFNWKGAEILLKTYNNHIDVTDEEKNSIIHAALLLPLNHVLIGDTELKISKIRWFRQNISFITDLWPK